MTYKNTCISQKNKPGGLCTKTKFFKLKVGFFGWRDGNGFSFLFSSVILIFFYFYSDNIKVVSQESN